MEQKLNPLKINDLDLNAQNFQEREAVESLLEIQNYIDQNYLHQDWNDNQWSMKNRNKQMKSFNFTQGIKRSNPQLSGDSTNFIIKDKNIHASKYRRAKSLFDPIKIFKIVPQQVFSDKNHEKLNELSECSKKKIIHKYSDEIRNLSFKVGHPQKSLLFKRDQHALDQKGSLNQSVYGQSVMIQVQSYDQNFNKKEMEYLMSKTLGPRSFRSHLSLKKKQDSFVGPMFENITFDGNLPKEANNENSHKKGSKISSRSRFTAFVNRKTAKEANFKSNDQNTSLDLSSQKNEDLEKSLRLLLNNFKDKKIIESKDQTKISYLSSPNSNQGSINKIFDKEGIFKQYEEQEVKALKRMRINPKNIKNQDLKIVEGTKSIKNETLKRNRNLSKDNQNQVNDSIRISSPRKYYKRTAKKDIDESDLKIFEIKKLA